MTDAGEATPTRSLPCEGKAVLASRKKAARAATELRRKLRARYGSDQPIQAYHCPHHHGYHIGHPVGWRRKNNVPRPEVKVTL
jgi:hypothetical protein